MKKFILLFAIILLLSTHDIMAQMIVKAKPQRPKVVLVRPNKVYKNKVWIEGHWKWNKRTHNYQWIKGNWTKSRPNRTWKAGKWKKIPAGWKYVPGYWSRV